MTAVETLPVRIPESASVDQVTPQIVDPIDIRDWDDLIATHPNSTFFHSRAWAQTLASTYGFQCRYVAAQRGRRLYGLLPIMEARSCLRGTRAVSLPFTDECSMLTSNEAPREALMEVATHAARAGGWRHLEMCADITAEADASYYTHRLALDRNASQVFDRCDSAVRRAVRKAERSGVSVRFATDLESLRDYYRLHCRTRTRLGSPPQPFRFFVSICEHILEKGHGFIALAMHDGRPVSGAVFFQFNGRAIYKFSASDERLQELRGANLVIWRAIEKLIASGARELNFGRTSLANAGLRRFKLNWGAEESVIARIRYSFENQSTTLVRDLATGAQARLFAALPVCVSRWIGSLAYPHLT